MAGEYRCGRGHRWTPDGGAAGDAPTCPVCGDTAELMADLTVDLRPASGSVVGHGGSSLVEFTDRPDAPSGEPPGAVPGYEVLHEVGRGGMGVVYKARQVALGRTVALKMILAGAHAGPAERERFRREAQAVAALQHPHIVQVFEVGDAGGHPYLALEFVEGGSLAQHRPGQPWPAREAAALVELVARAVHYAHGQGVVHRDLKPANILLASAEPGARNPEPAARATGSGFRAPGSALPKITDFGLAKRIDSAPGDDGATRTGAVMGTPSYIAPEQAAGKAREVGPAADVYSLGAILYELLTGRPPFRGETPLDTVLQVVRDDALPPRRVQPGVPKDLDTVVLKCLHKDPAKRYGSAFALAEDLRRYLAGEPIVARPLGPWGRTLKWSRRHPAAAAFVAVSVAATVAVVAVLGAAYARVSEAVVQKEREADAARLARLQEEVQRKRAEEQTLETEKARAKAQGAAEQLGREAERNRRAAYALRLAQAAALAERDPGRAAKYLDDPGLCPPDLRDFTWGHLRRLCHREDRVYVPERGGGPMHAVAVAPGGAFVATAGADGVVSVWDPRTGRVYAVLAGHRGPVRGLAFSPDGDVLATAGAEGTVRLWEFPATVLDTARRAMTYAPFLNQFVRPAVLTPAVTLPADPVGGVNCVAFAPDGRTVAAGLGNGTVEVWDLGGWRPNPLDTAALGGPGAVALAAARGDGIRVAREIAAHDGPVRSLAFSNSGLLAAGGDDDAVTVHRADDGELVRSLGGFGGPVRAVAFTPDGRTLLAANNGPAPTVRQVSTETWKDGRRLTGHTGPVLALAVSPDGSVVASGGADGAVRLWDAETGRERGVLKGHMGEVRGLAFGADRRMVASAGADGTGRVWQAVARASEDGDLTDGGEGALVAAAAGGGGWTFLAADETGRPLVRLGEPVGGRGGPGPFFVYKFQMPPGERIALKAVAAAPDGMAVVGATDRELWVWRFYPRPRGPRDAGPPVAPVRPVRVPAGKEITALALDPAGRRLAVLDAAGVRVWDFRQLLLLAAGGGEVTTPRPIPGTAGGTGLAFSPHGDRLAVASGKGFVVVDLAGEVVADRRESHPAAVTAVAFSPDGERVASADAGGLVKDWRVRPDGGLDHQADLAGHADAVTALAFAADNKTLASGGADRTVVLWDPDTGQERTVLTGHADRLLAVDFAGDGRALVTISRDGVVKRWQADPHGSVLPAPPTFSRPAPPPPSPPGRPRQRG